MAWKVCSTAALGQISCSTSPARQLLDESPISDDPHLYRYRLLLDLYDASLAIPSKALDVYAKAAARIIETPDRPDGPNDGCRYFWREVLVFERLDQEDQARNLVKTCRDKLEGIVASRDRPLFELARLGVAYAYLGLREAGDRRRRTSCRLELAG